MTSSSTSRRRVLVVGGGLAGLACARDVVARGHDAVVFEASDRVGGRCTSDVVDGFTLDRGFQILLTAYREVRTLVDLNSLDLRAFWPGAMVFDGRRLRSYPNPLREPVAALASLCSGGIGWDELRSALPLARAMRDARDEHAVATGSTALAWLRERGIAPSLIERFFRPFFAGVFLDPSLETDAGRLRFYMSCFAQGEATVPAGGMRRLPEAIAAQLPPGTVRTSTPIVRATSNSVELAGGGIERGDTVVLAVDMSSLGAFVPGAATLPWLSTITLWFATNGPTPLGRRLLLNGSGRGVTNHIADLSAVAPEYAPRGRGLVAANIVGRSGDLDRGVGSVRELAIQATTEIEGALGRSSTQGWELVKVDRIDRAIPRQHPRDLAGRSSDGAQRLDGPGGMIVAGDHCADASINGALRSGRSAAALALA
jgi:phytoene dehydrogenase-like protein